MRYVHNAVRADQEVTETMIAYVLNCRGRSTNCASMTASVGSVLIILALFVGRELNCFLHFN